MNSSFQLIATFPNTERVIDCNRASQNNDVITIDDANRLLIWYTDGGLRVIRQYSLSKSPRQVKVCQLKIDDRYLRCLCVLITQSELNIYMPDGQQFDLLLPCAIKSIHSMNFGILFESLPRSVFAGSKKSIELFLLTSPNLQLKLVNIERSKMLSSESFDNVALGTDDKIYCINRKAKKIIIFQIKESTAIFDHRANNVDNNKSVAPDAATHISTSESTIIDPSSSYSSNPMTIQHPSKLNSSVNNSILNDTDRGNPNKFYQMNTSTSMAVENDIFFPDATFVNLPHDRTHDNNSSATLAQQLGIYELRSPRGHEKVYQQRQSSHRSPVSNMSGSSDKRSAYSMTHDISPNSHPTYLSNASNKFWNSNPGRKYQMVTNQVEQAIQNAANATNHENSRDRSLSSLLSHSEMLNETRSTNQVQNSSTSSSEVNYIMVWMGELDLSFLISDESVLQISTSGNDLPPTDSVYFHVLDIGKGSYACFKIINTLPSLDLKNVKKYDQSDLESSVEEEKMNTSTGQKMKLSIQLLVTNAPSDVIPTIYSKYDQIESKIKSISHYSMRIDRYYDQYSSGAEDTFINTPRLSMTMLQIESKFQPQSGVWNDEMEVILLVGGSRVGNKTMRMKISFHASDLLNNSLRNRQTAIHSDNYDSMLAPFNAQNQYLLWKCFHPQEGIDQADYIISPAINSFQFYTEDSIFLPQTTMSFQDTTSSSSSYLSDFIQQIVNSITLFQKTSNFVLTELQNNDETPADLKSTCQELYVNFHEISLIDHLHTFVIHGTQNLQISCSDIIILMICAALGISFHDIAKLFDSKSQVAIIHELKISYEKLQNNCNEFNAVTSQILSISQNDEGFMKKVNTNKNWETHSNAVYGCFEFGSIGFMFYEILHLKLQDHKLKHDLVVNQHEKIQSIYELHRILTWIWQFSQSLDGDYFQNQHMKKLLLRYQIYSNAIESSVKNNEDDGLECLIPFHPHDPYFQHLLLITSTKKQSSISYLKQLLISHEMGLCQYTPLRLASYFAYYCTTLSMNESSKSSATTALNAFIYAIHRASSLQTECTTDFAIMKESKPKSFSWLSKLEFFPPSLKNLIELALGLSASSPNSDWPDEILLEIGRDDLCDIEIIQTRWQSKSSFATRNRMDTANFRSSSTSPSASLIEPEQDGLKDVEESSLSRFVDDERLREVCRMLRSSAPIYLKLERAPEVSDLDHRHKMQLRLLVICKRSFSCSVGRGMVTFDSLQPLIAEALTIPRLSTTARIPPNNIQLQLDTTLASVDLVVWPEFHNGVAIGLRIGSKEKLTLFNNTHSKKQRSSHANRGNFVTRNWILFNRTASQHKVTGDAANDSFAVAATQSSHAGFLLALGLLGHLSVLSIADVCDYLTQGHEPTTMAILIGCAASKIASADPILSKTLCLHIPALLPPNHWDIDISPLVQGSALIGLGLVHCGSGHRLMTEFLLAELGRKPISDGCEAREALALSAGWALGLVLLGKRNVGLNKDKEVPTKLSPEDIKHPSDAFNGLLDLHIEDRLQLYIDGGIRPKSSHIFPATHHNSDPNSRSSRVMESDIVNTDVTAPGAIIALGLIFIQSNRTDILKRLKLPTTAVALDSINPHLLLYRALSQCLVSWDTIPPTEEWIEQQIPAAIISIVFPRVQSNVNPSKTEVESKNIHLNTAFNRISSGLSQSSRYDQIAMEVEFLRIMKKEAIKLSDGEKFQGISPQFSSQLDRRTALQLYLHIVTGYCYGIGLIYAGTFDVRAKHTLVAKLKFLQSLRDNKPMVPPLGISVDKLLKPAIEMCICTVALSTACVMAGSGDLEILRVLRELRWKLDDVSSGSHMALAMAIGMLFVGGGRYSFKRDPLSIACLLLSICPRYPSRSPDNQYHLQPLRHLYVLAVENRSLRTIDVDTGEPVSTTVRLNLNNGKQCDIQAPGLLPELSTVHSIEVTNPFSATQKTNLEGEEKFEGNVEFTTKQKKYYSRKIILEHIEESDERRIHSRSIQNKRSVFMPPLYLKTMQSDSRQMIHSITLSHLAISKQSQTTISPLFANANILLEQRLNRMICASFQLQNRESNSNGKKGEKVVEKDESSTFNYEGLLKEIILLGVKSSI